MHPTLKAFNLIVEAERELRKTSCKEKVKGTIKARMQNTESFLALKTICHDVGQKVLDRFLSVRINIQASHCGKITKQEMQARNSYQLGSKSMAIRNYARKQK